MSVDLAVWFAAAGATLAEAARTYGRYCDEVATIAAPARPEVAAFHADLVERYPDLRGELTDEQASRSPWSYELAVFDDAVLMTMTGSRATRVVPVATQLAEAHGLVLFNPQNATVIHPEVMRSRPSRVLWTEDGSQRDDPDPPTVREMLGSLTARNSYAVLEHLGGPYVQAAWFEGSRSFPAHYDLEYAPDGGPDSLVGVRTGEVADVERAFVGFVLGDDGWADGFAWERVRI